MRNQYSDLFDKVYLPSETAAQHAVDARSFWPRMRGFEDILPYGQLPKGSPPLLTTQYALGIHLRRRLFAFALGADLDGRVAEIIAADNTFTLPAKAAFEERLNEYMLLDPARPSHPLLFTTLSSELYDWVKSNPTRDTGFIWTFSPAGALSAKKT